MQSNEVSTQFPLTRLPKELRLLVWEATFEPQFILLRHVEGRRPRSPLPVFAFKPYDDPKAPVALQVCQESRAFGLEHYKRWTLRWYLHDRIARSKVIMWNPDHDIVVLPKNFNSPNGFNLDWDSRLNLVKNLAIPERFWLLDRTIPPSLNKMSIIAKAFPSLEQLIICAGGEADRKDYDNPLTNFTYFHRLDPSYISKNIDSGLMSIQRDRPEWPLSIIKVWEGEDGHDGLYHEVFRVRVGPDKQPTYTCWCRPSRWDSSIHDRHGPELQTSSKDAPPPVVVWRRPRYGNRSHFSNRYKASGSQ